MLVKFIDDLLDGQLFLENLNEAHKSKQFAETEYVLTLEDASITDKNNLNVEHNDVGFVCQTCGLMLADKNDLSTHLKSHSGNN